MKKFRNEKGITLVELLVVLAIGGIIMALVMGILGNGQNQHRSQTAKADQLNDVRYAAKVITKEIRKADKVVVVNSSSLNLGNASHVSLTLNNNRILQNDATLVSGIEEFTISWDEEEERLLKIKIVSSNQKGQNQKIETEIFIREGVGVE